MRRARASRARVAVARASRTRASRRVDARAPRAFERVEFAVEASSTTRATRNGDATARFRARGDVATFAFSKDRPGGVGTSREPRTEDARDSSGNAERARLDLRASLTSQTCVPREGPRRALRRN